MVGVFDIDNKRRASLLGQPDFSDQTTCKGRAAASSKKDPHGFDFLFFRRSTLNLGGELCGALRGIPPAR